MDDNIGIPDDLRCKRSDGKQWRCTAMSMPDKTVCEKHYIQAKKRAANSALRASLKRAKRRSFDPGADAAYLDDNSDPDMSVSPLRNASGGGGEYSSPSSGKKSREKATRGAHGDMYSSPDALKAGSSGRGGDFGQADEHRTGSVFSTPPRGKAANCYSRGSAGDYSGGSTDSSGKAEGLTCHQCRRNDRSRVFWCMNCDKRGFCDSCIAKWYNGIPMEELRGVCPVCRGICSCKSCRRGDGLIKARIRDISTIDKLRYLHSLLYFVLPALKKIHTDQCFELELENRVHGVTSSIPRARINPDEQMCCDICGIPIVDYHRHCTSCSTDICLDCCQDIRKSAAKRDCVEPSDSQDISSSTVNSERGDEPVLDDHTHLKESCLDFPNLFHKWKVNNDGSILCPGHRCSSPLVLRRIFKINWASKLVKNAEEMVNGCQVTDLIFSEKCISCSAGLSKPRELSELILYKCSLREKENLLYYPTSEDKKHDTYIHFRRHWISGEPVIVRQVLDSLLTSQWDPKKILRGVKEMSNEKIKEDNMVVKAQDCLTDSEVEIELDDFIRGYYEGYIQKSGLPQILKLKDWPLSEALEDFLICHIPELFSRLPLLEYIHSKWGLLNLSSKLPHETFQSDSGPKLLIAYGMQGSEEADSVTNLNVNINDAVYVLMHAVEVKFQHQRRTQNKNILEETEVSTMEEPAPFCSYRGFVDDSLGSAPNEESEADQHFSQTFRKTETSILDQKSNENNDNTCKENGNTVSDSSMGKLQFPDSGCAAVIWDVFHRQDVPKLNTFLTGLQSSGDHHVRCSVYDQAYFLHEDQKKRLKNELGIEPWTFVQCVGEAVFIPAGCAFQSRNIKSSMQLAFDFLSPESLSQSMQLVQEIRRLPNDHAAKLQLLEVGKMPLYAASWTIREIQKIALDPKLGSELRFEDQNLTAMVADNLRKVSERNQVACR